MFTALAALQRKYAIAKAEHDSVQERFTSYEAEFLRRLGIEADELFSIEKDDDFDRACDLFDAVLAASGFGRAPRDLPKIRQFLKAAENALIEIGLTLAPKGIRETLRKSKSLEIRRRLIDLAYRLDPGTVPTR
mgnify:CR=1 FL=1